MLIYVLGLYVLFQLADGYFTYGILQAGGKELNFIVKMLISKFGILNGLIIAKTVAIAIGFAICLFLPCPYPYYFLCPLTALYGLICIHNYHLWRLWH